MTQATIYLIIGAFTIGLGLGALGEYKWHEAGEVVIAHKQTIKAQDGEVKLVTRTQTINKDIHDAKDDKCLGASVPSSINKLLR